jgi:hypothetical protein
MIGNFLTTDFAPFIPLIQKSIKRLKLNSDEFELMVEKVLNHDPIEVFLNNLEMNDSKRLLLSSTNINRSVSSSMSTS